MTIWPQLPDVFALIPLLKVYLDYGTGFPISQALSVCLSVYLSVSLSIYSTF